MRDSPERLLGIIDREDVCMSPRMRLYLTVFLGVMSAMAPLATDMYLPALPVLQADFGVSASVAQLTLTMTMLGMAAGQMLMGPLSDRYGRTRPLLLVEYARS